MRRRPFSQGRSRIQLVPTGPKQSIAKGHVFFLEREMGEKNDSRDHVETGAV